MDGKPGITKKYNVNIAGISYQLVSVEPEEYVRQIASLADLTINKILNSNASLSVSQATILAMVNFIDTLNKTEKRLNDCESKLSGIVEKEVKMKTDFDKLRESNFEIKKEVLRLNELNKQLVLEIAALRQQEITGIEETAKTEEPAKAEEIVIAETVTEIEELEEIKETEEVKETEETEEAEEIEEVKEAEEVKETEETKEVKEIFEVQDVNSKTDEPDLVKDFLEDVEDPFASPDTDEINPEDDNKMFHPLRQQSLDDM